MSKDQLSKALFELASSGHLAGYAAHAAASELVGNWRAALQDGARLEQLLPDIDDTITMLENFKRELG